MSDTTLETLRDAILSLSLSEPRPVALWFVARHTEYVDLLKETSRALGCLAAPAYPRGPIVPRLYGVPIFTFDPRGRRRRSWLAALSSALHQGCGWK